jgi:hypothetical protein
MSTPAVSSLAYATQQTTIYLRSIILVFGLVSNVLNIAVFLSLRTFRESSCAFYLIAMSFVNIIQLFVGLLSRVLSVGFGIDWTTTSLAYCRFHSFCFAVFSLLSYTYMCLATIDQFLATCSNPRWQRYSNIKLARWLCAIFFIIWTLHGIPVIYFYNQVPTDPTGQLLCVITNDTFEQYYRYFFLVILIGIIPLLVTVSFGFLAYRNVQLLPYLSIPLVRRETDKQLTIMVLVQDVYNLFFIIPYVVVYLMVLNTDADQDSIIGARIDLASSITGALYYMTFSVSDDYLNLFS